MGKFPFSFALSYAEGFACVSKKASAAAAACCIFYSFIIA